MRRAKQIEARICLWGLCLLLLRKSRIQRCFCLINFCFQITRIELREQVAGLHRLIVGDVNLYDVSRNLRAYLNDVAIDEGIVS